MITNIHKYEELIREGSYDEQKYKNMTPEQKSEWKVKYEEFVSTTTYGVGLFDKARTEAFNVLNNECLPKFLTFYLDSDV